MPGTCEFSMGDVGAKVPGGAGPCRKGAGASVGSRAGS